MKAYFAVLLMGAGLAALLAGPAMAKPARHYHPHHAVVHHDCAGRHYAQSYYDYHSASLVREEFRDAPGRRHFHRHDDYRERQDGEVVENLRGDFTGGVGYGADGGAAGFVDGYGQMHFFVGSFRRDGGLPHGPFGPRGPQGRRF